MVEVVGKSNDPVVQCENCRNLVKYVENDVEYTTKHFNKLISSYLPRWKKL